MKLIIIARTVVLLLLYCYYLCRLVYLVFKNVELFKQNFFDPNLLFREFLFIEFILVIEFENYISLVFFIFL